MPPRDPAALLPPPPGKLPRIEREFYERDTTAVAQALLGQLLVRTLPNGTRLSGLIVETEAYLGPEDRAAHTFGGRRSPRNDAMWQRGGTCYVYFTYGMHYCMNLVTRDEQHPQAVLIRALQPVEGLDPMQRHRAAKNKKPKRDTDLCSGPAKLCQALAIDRDLNATDLCPRKKSDPTHPIRVERARARRLPASKIAIGPRIGIASAKDWTDKPLRFWVKGNPHVSV